MSPAGIQACAAVHAALDRARTRGDVVDAVYAGEGVIRLIAHAVLPGQMLRWGEPMRYAGVPLRVLEGVAPDYVGVLVRPRDP